MREPSPGAPSPRGSNTSLANGAVTRNMGFQQQNSSEHLPWSSPAISLPGNCNSNLTSENQSPMARTISNASALTSLCADLSASDSHFFEVLYIGKVRISQRKVPESLIDDALIKFAQHEADKALKQRRHSLLSSTGTSIYSGDSKDNLDQDSTPPPHELFKNNSKKILIPSTTPLEPDKGKTWASAEALSVQPKVDPKKIDDEFDMFTKERAETFNKEPPVIRKPNPTPLEPNVLILNVPKNNLDTVKEEDKSDIYSVISETASSITEFCQRTKAEDAKIDGKAPDPFLDNVKGREDSPAPMSFQEISRKPVVTERKTLNENKPFLRDRSASIGTINLKTPIAQLIGEQNRTMLFQVGRAELRLISPDRKQILLHRGFKDVASCVLGRINKEHFGFVCRETNDTYACYVFKCESDSVALELINAIKQAFIAHADLLKKTREKSPNMTCEHCPMLWYHRLCHDIEGMNDKKTHAFILRRIEQLPEDEQDLIITKYQGGTNHMYETGEHNSFLMMLLRAHCEAKQTRHVHDTAENRSEFLNQYLGGSTIFSKARRSISSSFDLLKRKASRDEIIAPPMIKKESSPLPTPVPIILDTSSEPSSQELLSPEQVRSKSLSPAVLDEVTPSPRSNMTPTPEESEETQAEGTQVNSPMMDIFLKVSDSRPAQTEAGSENEATWRQAIYEKIVQPEVQVEGELTSHRKTSGPKAKRTREELRQLWKMAIDQTILLVRMEKENARLKESEESSAVRRIKLEYTELGVCDAGVSLMWDSLLSRDSSQPMAKVDRHMLTQAVIQGVPRMSRGGVWYFLAEQAALRSAPPDTAACPLYHTPYTTLLAGLTKHQHAILIDLGRTFPKHSYFASALGPGQLALYNILKAYSLLDPDVGYCQGLSFVAGVLLLHMEEAEAFILLRHLMFRRGLRKQYLPDMSALQVQLYQLSRLLRDHEPELHAKLEALDISPALYAAPWMLTLFTSQFPLGFVVRVFDLIFLESLDIVFSVSLALLSAHKDGLMLCESCEEAAEYLKHKLPDMNRSFYKKVMKKVLSLDISRQLCDYAVEYAVLREEMPRLAALTEDNKQLVEDKNRMGEELDKAAAKGMRLNSRALPPEVVGRNYARYCELVNQLYDAYLNNVHLQRAPYILEIITVIVKRMYELRNELVHIIVNDYIYVDTALKQLHMTPLDIQIVVPYHFPLEARSEKVENILQQMWVDALKRKKRTERLKKSQPSPTKLTDSGTALDDTEAVEEEEIESESPPYSVQTEEYIQAVTIQKHERYRQWRLRDVRAKALHHKQYFSQSNEPAPIELRTKAAILVQKVYREFMKIKRDRVKENKRDILLGLAPDPFRKGPSFVDASNKMYERRRNTRLDIKKTYLEELQKEKTRLILFKKDATIEDITDEIREWFKEWFYGYGFFPQYPYELEGGTLMVVRGDYPTIEEKLEEDERLLKETKGKTKEQLKEEHKRAKEEAKMKAVMKKEADRKEAEALLKSRCDPFSDPGYTVQTSSAMENLIQALRNYRQTWSLYDELPAEQFGETVYGYLKPLLIGDLMKEIHVDCRKFVDELMRIDLKMLIQKHEYDYKQHDWTYPKMKPRKKPKITQPQILVLDEKLLKSTENIFDLGIVSKPTEKFSDIFGDSNYAAYEYNIKDPDASFPLPGYGDIKDRLMLSCVLGCGMQPGAPRRKAVMLLGPDRNGKSFLADAVAGELNAIKIDISPEVFSAVLQTPQKTLSQVFVTARAFQPAVVFMRNVERVFTKKVPEEQKILKATTLKGCLRKIVKSVPDEDKVIFIATCTDPWVASVKSMLSVFDEILLVPRTDYGSLQQFFYKKFQRLNVKQLSPGEFIDAFIQKGLEPLTLDDYQKYVDFYISNSELRKEREDYERINIVRADVYQKAENKAESAKTSTTNN